MSDILKFFFITVFLRDIDADLDSDGWALRLADGKTPFDGRPEVYLNDGFHVICDEYITPNVAKVICRELGLPPLNVTMKDSAYADIKKSFLRCSGDEESLMSDCNWNVFPTDKKCDSKEGLDCNGNIRLVHGENRTQGNVQIYRDGQLAGICDHKPDRKTAQVICAQLGYETEKAVLYMGSFFGPGLNSTHYIECTGDEATHEECQYIRTTDTSDCSEDTNLGVDCMGETIYHYVYTATFDEDYRNYHRADVEVKQYMGFWCDDVEGATSDELQQMTNIASVFCHKAGYSRYSPSLLNIAWGTWYQADEYLISIRDIICTGKEESLSECIRGRSWLKGGVCSTQEVIIKCNDFLQLADGDSSSGRVEFKENQNGTWMALQVLGPDPALANVLCFQLGFESTSARSLRLENFYGESTNEPWKYIYMCSGSEKNVGRCQIRELVENETTYTNVGVECNAHSIAVSTERIDVGNEVLTLSNGTDTMYACAGENAAIDFYTTGILCHALGYSIFESSYELTPLTGNETSITDIAVRAKCRGTESEFTQCALVKGTDTSESCTMAISLKCADRSCAAPPQQVKKTITCYEWMCDIENCDPGTKTKECSLDNGESCAIEKVYQKFGQRLLLLRSLTFCGQCAGEVYEDASIRRSRQCCYQDFCNTATSVIRTLLRVKLEKRTMDFEGQVMVMHQSLWKPIRLDERKIPNTFLKMVCYEAGYLNSSIAVIHSEPMTKLSQTAVIRVLDYNNCGTLGTPSCPVEDAISIGSLALTVNCNARSPPMRLVDGLTDNAGRLEVFYNNTWGTVCKKGFTDGSADLVCRTLGYSGGCSASSSIQPNVASFRVGQNKLHFSKLSCQGTEQNMWFCDHKFFAYEERGCSHADNVGIVCDDTDYANGIQVVPILTSQEQTTVNSPVIENTENLIQPKDMMCREGSCLTLGCNSSKTISFCNTTDGGVCYTEKRRGFTAGQTVLNFGCTKICKTGTKRNSGVQVTTICCSKSMCNQNVVSVVEELDQLEEGGFDEVTINDGNGLKALLNTLMLTLLLIINPLFLTIYNFDL